MPAIDYLELPTSDLGADTSFYAQAFGWTWTHYGPAYAATTDAGVELALNAQATMAPAQLHGHTEAIGPMALLRTEDLQSTLGAIEPAGGTIVTPPYDYPGGRRFHAADPSGNVLGVYEPAT